MSSKDTISSILNDDFESGNLLGWKHAEDWEVSDSEKISGTFSLKHLAKSISGSSAIFHQAGADWKLADVEWSFKLKNGNWDPSTSNRFWFYLSADTVSLPTLNGWAVGVNISGSTDLLQLWRIRNGKADSLIVQTDLDWNASDLVTITAKRTTRGVWTLSGQRAGESTAKTFSGTDPSCFSFRNIGIFFNYTQTRSGHLWIDDIAVNRRESELFIQKLTLFNSNSMLLVFNKPFQPTSVHAANFSLSDENDRDIPVLQIVPDKNDSKTLSIRFGNVQGSTLRLHVSGVADLSGQIMVPDVHTISYSFSPEPGSVLINEILFNPFAGGVDFVELVNVSGNTIPVYRLKLATRNDILALKQVYAVSTRNRYLNPGQYLVCTKDSQVIQSQYISCDPQRICTMTSMPSFADDAGTVVLLNDSLDVLDEFSYSSRMHSPFLADENGVSLERISLEKPAGDLGNWASAAASVGYATPGLPNSQAMNEAVTRDEIITEPKAFSPNGDGFNDQLAIHYQFNKPGYLANVRIFDVAGLQVNYLVKNESLARQGIWLWNGKSDSGNQLNIGVYIIRIEIFDRAGNTRAFKKTCTLTDRLD